MFDRTPTQINQCKGMRKAEDIQVGVKNTYTHKHPQSIIRKDEQSNELFL